MVRPGANRQSAAERATSVGAFVGVAGAVILLFWSLTSGMNHSSCRQNIANNPDCNNNGPAARTLLAWSVLAIILFAASLVTRRCLRRARLERSGINFTASTNPRVLRGDRMLRRAGWACWAGAVGVLLALAVTGAGAVLGVVSLVAFVGALALWASGLRLKRR